MKPSYINFSPAASLFGDSDAQDCFYYLCRILAFTGDKFREITLDEAVEKAHVLWPAYSRMIEYNLRKHHRLVFPSVRSAFDAAQVSNDVKGILFDDNDEYKLIEWAADQVRDLDPEQIGTYAQILEPPFASVEKDWLARKVIFRAYRYGTAETIKWEWVFEGIER